MAALERSWQWHGAIRVALLGAALGACQGANPAYVAADRSEAGGEAGRPASGREDGAAHLPPPAVGADAGAADAPAGAADARAADAASSTPGAPLDAPVDRAPAGPFDTLPAADAGAARPADGPRPADPAPPLADAAAPADAACGCPPLTYQADPAACLDVERPDPDACARIVGTEALNLDSLGGPNDRPFGIYLRFAVGNELAGRTITAVRLQLRTVDNAEGEGNSSGEVWRVAPFTAADLATVVPAKVGTAPIAREVGFVRSGTTVEWSLPTNVVAPGKALHVAVLPLSSDRVLYVRTGALAPTLRIDSR
jgi:hypothetical protein